MKSDLTYLTTGLFTVFFPENKQGEIAYNELCEALGNNSGKIYTYHLKNVLNQLKTAGYKVSRAKMPKETIEDILNDKMFMNELGI